MRKLDYVRGLGVLIWMAGTGVAQEPKTNPVEQGQNIKITADSLECDQTTNICIAEGKAVVEKLNDTDKRTIHAEHIEMHFEKSHTEEKTGKTTRSSDSTSTSGHKAKEFRAKGDVVITIKDSIIRGDRGVYIPDTEIAEVYENVSVTSGHNQVVGNYGRANLKTGEYKVLNSEGRVTALVFQEDNKTKIEKQKDGTQGN